MSKDNLSSLIRALETTMEAMRPYLETVSIMQRNNYYANLLTDSFANRVGMMDRALNRGLCDDKLAQTVGQWHPGLPETAE